MTDETVVLETEIDAVARPSDTELGALLPEIRSYILWLEEREQLLYDELDAKPGAEARGICWFDLFGGVTSPNGSRHEVKFNTTQRSDVGVLHAFRLAFTAAKRIKGEYHMTPYIQSMIPAARGGNGSPQAEPPSEPAGDTPTRGAPAGDTPTREVEPTGAPTATQEPIADEKWYKVKSIKVVFSQDETQKYLRVKMGNWSKHGLPAYLDSSNIPDDVVGMVESGEWSTEHKEVAGETLISQFTDMQWALVDTKAEHKQVLQFAENKPA